MEALFLLFSIIVSFLTSAFLSLLLPLQSLTLLLAPSSPNRKDDDVIRLYQGHVRHVRRRPVVHAFQYDVRYALLGLDHGPASLPQSLFRSHLSAHEARRVTGTSGPVFLLTIPPSVGYEQNPLSVYYCYDLQGSTTVLTKCIAEVTNTPWGERVSFVFNPDSDLVAKSLHVSPFMDMHGNWRVRANSPGEDLFLEISVQHPELGNYFSATLKAKRIHSTSCAFRSELFFWLMPQKVALWIYWQALQLWWKNISIISHPKYTNPAYRDEALTRDRKLQCPEVTKKSNSSKHAEFDDGLLNDANDGNNGNSGGRRFMWRDALWPWS